MEQFASGWKRSYYGKGDVTAYRLNRDGQRAGRPSPVFGANVLMLLCGDAFWPTYTTGDNTGLIATDSMKNFIQRETLNFAGYDLEGYVRFLAETFLARYSQVDVIQVSATEIPYTGLPRPQHTRQHRSRKRPQRRPREHDDGAARSSARSRLPAERAFAARDLRDATRVGRGLRGFRLLRLGGSAFHGFVRDEYTTLPESMDRPLHMWLDVEWTYIGSAEALNDGRVRRRCAPDRARHLRSLRIRQHPAGDLSDRHEAARDHSGDRGGAPRSEQPHVGYHCRTRRPNWASTQTRALRTDASG